MRAGRLQVSVAGLPVQVFDETDYCYGIGPLALRLHRIGWERPVPLEGDTWLEVEGRIIDHGTGRPGKSREVLVRACKLPEQPARLRPRLRD
jgi:hypothetical protein